MDFIHDGKIVLRLTKTFLPHFLNCSMLFTDNQSHSLIWKHYREDKGKGLVIKGFPGMSQVIYCSSYKGYTVIEE